MPSRECMKSNVGRQKTNVLHRYIVTHDTLPVSLSAVTQTNSTVCPPRSPAHHGQLRLLFLVFDRLYVKYSSRNFSANIPPAYWCLARGGVRGRIDGAMTVSKYGKCLPCLPNEERNQRTIEHESTEGGLRTSAFYRARMHAPRKKNDARKGDRNYSKV